ncbi:hypothetical protein AB0M12_37980 [Nocardia vinacea]|uniref:hypothetical protein n=1 Tax=Nocardia vinacea TaxID=96468 RepID=UPI003412222E
MTVENTVVTTGAVLTTDGAELAPEDDRIHDRPSGIDRWAENIQWNVRDQAGLGVMWHMGTMLDDPRLWHVVVAVTLPDGQVYSVKTVAPGTGQFGPPHAQLSVVDPFRKWAFHYHGGMVDMTGDQGATGLVTDERHVPVEIDLDLDAAYPVWIPEGSTDFGDWGRFHHEQTVEVSGTITIGGTTHRLTGIGHRDHSIGPRDMSHLQRAFWGNGVFESGWAFATMFGEYTSGEFQRAAVFHRDGSQSATMVRWSNLDKSDGEPRLVTVELDIDGTRKILEGRIRHGMTFTVVDGAEFAMGTDLRSPDRYMLTNLFIDWTCDGEAGIGYLDRGALIRLLQKEVQ